MGVQALKGAEGFEGREGFAQGGFAQLDPARAPLKHVSHEPGERFSAAPSGQRVAWAGEKIAGGHGRIIPQKNCASGSEFGGELLGVLGEEGDVFRGVVIAEGHGLIQRLDEDEVGAGLQNALQMIPAAQSGALGSNFAFHGFELIGAIGGENDAATFSVFGLSEEVCGDPCGGGVGVGNDKDLARAREEIDGHFAKHLALGFYDVGVAGPHDFLDWSDGVCSKSESGDGLRSADLIHLGGAGEAEGKKEGVIDASGGVCGGGDDDLGNACGLCQGDGHDGRGDQGGGSSRHVDADTLEGVETLPHPGALCIAHFPILAKGPLRESSHIGA